MSILNDAIQFCGTVYGYGYAQHTPHSSKLLLYPESSQSDRLICKSIPCIDIDRENFIGHVGKLALSED